MSLRWRLRNSDPWIGVELNARDLLIGLLWLEVWLVW